MLADITVAAVSIMEVQKERRCAFGLCSATVAWSDTTERLVAGLGLPFLLLLCSSGWVGIGNIPPVLSSCGLSSLFPYSTNRIREAATMILQKRLLICTIYLIALLDVALFGTNHVPPDDHTQTAVHQKLAPKKSLSLNSRGHRTLTRRAKAQ